MEKKIAGLLGAVAALGTFTGGQAASASTTTPSDVLQAQSYADLLKPIPNAAQTLQALDEHDSRKSAEVGAEVAQLYYHHHHHHHHHHGYWHHHHHHGYWRPPVYVIPPRRFYHHHHHHHHHGYFYED